ncbi:MAG: recombinase family protein [Planctomycetaceae bacterium]|nr:recombinase family protein [Planctomycetaceae bacterium]
MSRRTMKELRAAESRTVVESSLKDERTELEAFERSIVGNSDTAHSSPLPRPPRTRRRSHGDRGLPPIADLAKLAEVYLCEQRRLWPELANSGLLPEPTEDIVQQMAEDFQARHRGAVPDVNAMDPFHKLVRRLGGAYCRYSCDNSSTNSILDQMTNCLQRAQAEDRFIPWQYVHADYSVTGRDSSRVGYTAYKALLKSTDHLVETTYIDDFTRASRDEIEWWKLAALSKRLDRGLVGASDNFNLRDPNSEALITIYGLLSRLFLKGLREKVLRGMKGAARRRTVVGMLSLGFTRCPLVDEHGNIVQGPDGRPTNVPCIDPHTSSDRRLLFELFVDKCWSTYQIAREFNRRQVDSSEGWTVGAIRNLLWSPSAIGVFVWNRTRNEFDPESQIWRRHKNPRSEWVVYYDPELALVPLKDWCSARRKLAAARHRNPRTGRKPSRNENSASTLFSGTLYCACCQDRGLANAELKLIRSAGKYQQMGCSNGTGGAHACTLTSSKSVRIIEESLLAYLRNVLFTESAVDDLVVRANSHLQAEGAKPQVDTAPLQRLVRKLESKISGLVRRVEEKLGDPVCEEYEKRIRQLKAELTPLRDQLREAQRINRRQELAPIDRQRVQEYLQDLRGVLNQETPVAAESLRILTGPIRIHQEPIAERKNGARWVATFAPDLVRLLRRLGHDRSYPDSAVLDSLPATTPETATVELHQVPRYEQLAPEFQRLRDNGASVATIAAAHGVTWQVVQQALDFGNNGKRPTWKPGRRTGRGARPQKYQSISPQVAELRDAQWWTFSRIAKHLGVGEGTVRRAYDFAHREEIQLAAEQGRIPDRGSYCHRGEQVYQRIRQLIHEGWSDKAIAAELRCGQSTVRRERERGDEDRQKSKR